MDVEAQGDNTKKCAHIISPNVCPFQTSNNTRPRVTVLRNLLFPFSNFKTYMSFIYIFTTLNYCLIAVCMQCLSISESIN